MNRKRTFLGLTLVLLLSASVRPEPRRQAPRSGAPDDAFLRARLEQELILAERTAIMLERVSDALARWDETGVRR